MQTFLDALKEEETHETQKACIKILEDIKEQNDQDAEFKFEEVKNSFKLYKNVLSGKEQEIPLNYNSAICQHAIIKGVQLYVVEQEGNNQLRQKCHADPDCDRDEKMADFKEEAQKNVLLAEDRIQATKKHTQN